MSDNYFFPSQDSNGLSIREYFAAQFLQGMLAHPTRYKPHNDDCDWMECISNEAVKLADALMTRLGY